MTKQQLAQALAESLNILNGWQADATLAQQNEFNELLSMIPERAIVNSDFRNNGTIKPAQLTNN